MRRRCKSTFLDDVQGCDGRGFDRFYPTNFKILRERRAHRRTRGEWDEREGKNARVKVCLIIGHPEEMDPGGLSSPRPLARDTATAFPLKGVGFSY